MTAANQISTTAPPAGASPSLIGVAKRLVNRALPGLGYRVRTRRRERAFATAHGGAEFRAKTALVAAHGKRVIGGPFAGLKYGDNVSCSAYVAKLVGSYEEELHGAIDWIIARQHPVVIDVGSAEGYYAVGLAYRMPATRVHAFDADPDAQRMCRALAGLNGVADRVSVGGWCDHAALDRLAGPGALVVCDCEGFELDLLDPAKVPALRSTDILVELHDLFRPGLTDALLARFRDTHAIELIDTRPRDPGRYEVLAVVDPADRPWAVREGRHGEMQWAYLTCKQS